MLENRTSVVAMTADIIAAYVEANHVQAGDLPDLIQSVHSALTAVSQSETPAATQAVPAKATSAQIRKSITDDALISFIDGRPYKMLRRHLAVHGMTVDDYKAKFGLPANYPTTAPAYSAARSQMAKSLGLGRGVRKGADEPAAVKPTRKPRAKKV